MRKTLKEFCYGNMIPCEQQITASSELRRAAEKISCCEQRLTERLGETDRALLAELVNAQRDIEPSRRRKTSSWVSGWRQDDG